MEKKEVSIEAPIAVAGVTLVPVVEVSLNCYRVNGGISFFSVKQPVGIVVVSQSAKMAFRITGEEVPLDRFLQDVPAVRKVLEAV